MPHKKDAPGMRGYRPRDTAVPKKGLLEKKRKDTLIKTIKKVYKVDLPFREDMQLGNALKKARVPSLKKLLKKYR